MPQETRAPLPEGFRLQDGKLQIESCLGIGGFGITYRARDILLARSVAIKEFFPFPCVRRGPRLTPGGHWSVPTLDSYKARFLEEGRVLARLRHPGIVQVYSIFVENETVYLVMEFLEGQTLSTYRKAQGGRLSAEEAVGLIRQVGAALEEMHRAGLLHRDIKPANIMRRPNGEVVLIDFGSAREFVADDQTVLVARGFAPLEQYQKRGVRGPFTDVYGLAATLYCLLTGEVPTDATLRAVGEPLAPPHELTSTVPRTLSDTILRGMALHGADRPPTVEAFLAALLPEAEPLAGTIRINPKDGMELVYVPAGEFLMGTTEEQFEALLREYPDWNREWFEREKPQRKVYVDGYWIGKTEVTVAQYRKFCEATKREMPEPLFWGWEVDHPIVHVTWHDAEAYCRWAGGRLPTEAQWEKAARGADGREYLWGDAWDANKCNNWETGPKGTTPVGSSPSGASPYGCLDMAGNVWEWCADWYGPYDPATDRNPSGAETGEWRVLRGGSWSDYDPVYFRCASRYNNLPHLRYIIVGFRCAGTP